MQQKKVVLYSSPMCTFCYFVKIFLKKNGIKFEEIDIKENEKAAEELFKKTGSKSVPTIFVGDKFVIGYDQKKLKELLGLND
ncbi:MAG: glutaredoxin family protein [Candidatus Diapherotrites archaeon]|nr:glutaredoxin family protein [Candidatus Diapherotrites archaeon]